LTYGELTARAPLERDVLLICPGFFAYKGRWKGVSISGLLAEAGLRPEAVWIEISGPKGARERNERFTLEEVRSDRVFLAYQVNGQPLPQKHGFPVRLVAEDHYGSRWVKYVDRITALNK
jgi:sulfoxide reductase catalytic subunit YedY